MSVFSTNCIFCYRERTSQITQVETCSEDREKGNLNQFMKLAKRYLESGFKLDKLNVTDGQVEFGACQDCVFMVDSFCDLYREWKYLEMRMEWELRKLCDVINAADKLCSKRLNIHDNATEKNSLDIFKEIRMDLKRKFIQRLSKSYPKVVIQPFKTLTKTENSDCGNVQAPLDTCAIFPKELFLGWIVTFSAITLLGLHGFNQGTQSFQLHSSNITDSDINEDDNEIEGGDKAGSIELSFSLEHEKEIVSQTTQQSVMECKPEIESSTFETPATSQPALTLQTQLQFRKRKGFPETSSTTKSRKCLKTKPAGAFRCFSCSKNFTSFLQLHSHRRAFTHILTKLKMAAYFKNKKTNTQLTKQDGTASDANVAFLRPLQKLKQQMCKEDGIDSSSEEEPYQSGYDDDWRSSSSSSDDDISSSSSSTSICGDEDSFRCQFCDKKFAYLKRHEWRCRLNPACVSKSSTAKSRARKYNSSQETVELEKEVKNDDNLHGSFPCSLCEVVVKYAPDLALHESEHMKKVKPAAEHVEKRLATRKLVRYCARCNYASGDKHNFIKHYLQIHLNLSCLPAKQPLADTHTSTPMLAKPVLHRDINVCDKQSSCYLSKPPNSCSRVCDVNEECRKMFESEQDLENHRQLHGSFPCTFCPVVVSYASKLAVHESFHGSSSTSSRRVYNCFRCTFTFKKRYQYVTHFLETHLNLPSESVICQNCGAKFPNYRELEQHNSSTHDIEKLREEEILRCDQCPAYFVKHISLITHKKKMHGEDNLTCLDCGRRYASVSAVRVHRRVVHKKKEADFPHICELPGCERRFERVSELIRHKNWLHGDKGKDKSLICHECGKKLPNKSGFISHMRLHQTDKVIKKAKIYVCEECGKHFRAQTYLDVHKLSHTGPSSWKYCCLFCDKKSATERLLMEHLGTHTREKPYICEYCDEEYAHGHNLRNHKNKKHDANDRPRARVIVNGQASRKGQKLPPRANI